MRDQKTDHSETMNDIPILFQDDDILVIDKPPGLTVNRAQSVKERTIQDWIDENFTFQILSIPPRDPLKPKTEGEWNTPEEDFVARSGMAHRIDKETSGILLIAKNVPSFIELQRQFKDHIVKKTYQAIVHGDVIPKDGVIKAPVDRVPWNRQQFGIVPGGKESETEYHCDRTFASPHVKNELLSLLTVHPKSGRTHQIRVHLKYINHPILGDYLYAGRKTAKFDRSWVPRVMLHAAHITFVHPKTGKELEIDAPMPDDMKRVISEN